MEESRKIIKLLYVGETDENGLPHGEGELRYVVEPDLEKEAEDPIYKGTGDLRYKGHFEHGLRQGDGDLHGLGLTYNPVSQYAWYSEGDYDGCGRLIHSSNPSGSWKSHVQCWYPYFEGTWKNDMPLKSRWGGRITKNDRYYIQITSREELEKSFPFTFPPNQ
jgi:hypothetical protein